MSYITTWSIFAVRSVDLHRVERSCRHAARVWCVVVHRRVNSVGGEVVVGGMGSGGVVVGASVVDDHAGFQQRVEAPPVEQLVTEPAVEGLDLGVLPGWAGVDEQ